MIIGVDESGSFRPGSRGLFVGIFLRPSERDSVVNALRAWEKRARKSLQLSNELKGHAINDTWARSLFRDVLAFDGHRRVRYLAFAVDVSDASMAAMDVQRAIFLEEYGVWAADLRDRNEVKRAQWVEQHAEWIRHRPSVQLLKLVTLGTVITTLVEWAMPQAILGGYDDELEHLRVMIDRGYVKQDDLARWRELLRNALINETGTHPIAILDTWPADHPFLSKFIERGGNGPMILKPAFGEMINFHDSLATPEVRVADLLASLIYRATISDERVRSYELIRGLALDTAPYRLIQWTTHRRTPMPNPYLTLDQGTD